MRDRGFTMFEVLAAMVIVALGLVSVLGLFAYGNRATALQQDRILAMSVLRRAVEEARAKDFGFDVRMPAGSSFPEYPPNISYEVLQDLNFAPPLAIKRIDVTVSWTTTGWGAQEETVTTLVAQR